MTAEKLLREIKDSMMEYERMTGERPCYIRMHQYTFDKIANYYESIYPIFNPYKTKRPSTLFGMVIDIIEQSTERNGG